MKLGTWNKVILKFELGNLQYPLGSHRNAFEILIAKLAEPQLPAKATDYKPGLDPIRNDVVDWRDKLGAGWTPHSMDSGHKLVKTLSSLLWYVEHQHNRPSSSLKP